MQTIKQSLLQLFPERYVLSPTPGRTQWPVQ